MGRQHEQRWTVGENQHWQKEIILQWEGMIRKIRELLQHRWQQNWIFILKTLFPWKTVWHEVQKSNIHGRAVTAKPLITEGNAQLCKWCHDHKTWTSDDRKHSRDTVRWVILHVVPYFRKSCHRDVGRTPKEAYDLECLVPTVRHAGGSVMVSAAIPW
jgi:hypothetical protein